MSSTAAASQSLIEAFAPVSLDTLNERAAMLERIDGKYVLADSEVALLLPALAADFDILAVDGRRSFAYENCYFDGPDLQSYHDHHRGRRRRNKVRMRRYVDDDLCFVELKLKDRRGLTVKRRLACDPAAYGDLGDDAERYIRDAYEEAYQQVFPYKLSRSIETRYRRITLVGRNRPARVTFDSAISFAGPGQQMQLGQHIHIVETKSPTGNDIADRLLRDLQQHPVDHCSKYCVGLALLQTDLKHNRFNPVLRRLAAAGPAWSDH